MAISGKAPPEGRPATAAGRLRGVRRGLTVLGAALLLLVLAPGPEAMAQAQSCTGEPLPVQTAPQQDALFNLDCEFDVTSVVAATDDMGDLLDLRGSDATGRIALLCVLPGGPLYAGQPSRAVPCGGSTGHPVKSPVRGAAASEGHDFCRSRRGGPKVTLDLKGEGGQSDEVILDFTDVCAQPLCSPSPCSPPPVPAPPPPPAGPVSSDDGRCTAYLTRDGGDLANELDVDCGDDEISRVDFRPTLPIGGFHGPYGGSEPSLPLRCTPGDGDADGLFSCVSQQAGQAIGAPWDLPMSTDAVACPNFTVKGIVVSRPGEGTSSFSDDAIVQGCPVGAKAPAIAAVPGLPSRKMRTHLFSAAHAHGSPFVHSP